MPIIRGIGKRYLITCQKCGYQWLAYKENPDRCALCNNPEPDKPYKRKNKERR